MTASLSIIIPTFRRNDGLVRAVDSIFAQSDPGSDQIELILADNDPDGGALAICDRLAAQAPDWLCVRVVHEPEAGVANVRNAALAAARSRRIAFIDDDQTVAQGWLGAVLSGFETLNAPVIFGPIATVLPAECVRHRAYFDGFFDRTGPASSQRIDHFYGCGNAMLDLDLIALPAPLFDARANETGGEDDYLFERLAARGDPFGWNADALAHEHVPQARATLRYTLRRAFGYGQGSGHHAWRAGGPRRAAIPVTMAAGAAQALVFAIVGGAASALRLPRAAWCLDKAARGLGKVFWTRQFSQRFYGQSQIAAQPTPAFDSAE